MPRVATLFSPGRRSSSRWKREYAGQTIRVPQGNYTTLNLAGAAVNGGQQNQPLTLTFSDNPTATWTQSFSDWGLWYGTRREFSTGMEWR